MLVHRPSGIAAERGKKMHKNKLSVTVNGAVNVTVNGDVELQLASKIPESREENPEEKKAREERERAEIRGLVQRIQDNPADNEAMTELIRRFNRLTKSVVRNHHVQPSEQDYIQGYYH